jgi:outer membrane immunogenic protein
MRNGLTTSAALLLCAEAAQLSETPAQAAQSLFTWTGCYAGLQAGIDFGRSDWSSAPYNFGSRAVAAAGAIGGVQAGCNVQTGQFVIGAGGEIWASGLAGSSANSDFEGADYDVRSDAAGEAALRAGYAFDRTLVFGKIGVVVARYRYEFSTYVSNPPGWTDAFDASRVGLALGLGAEYALDAHWSVKVECDHIVYAGKTTELSSYGYLFPVSFNDTETILKAGANYRF